VDIKYLNSFENSIGYIKKDIKENIDKEKYI